MKAYMLAHSEPPGFGNHPTSTWNPIDPCFDGPSLGLLLEGETTPQNKEQTGSRYFQLPKKLVGGFNRFWKILAKLDHFPK